LIERTSLTTFVVCPYRSGVFQVPSQQTINRRLAGSVCLVEDMRFALLLLGADYAQKHGRGYFIWKAVSDPFRAMSCEQLCLAVSALGSVASPPAMDRSLAPLPSVFGAADSIVGSEGQVQRGK
jgi:hypothetical protein